MIVGLLVQAWRVFVGILVGDRKELYAVEEVPMVLDWWKPLPSAPTELEPRYALPPPAFGVG